MDRRRDGHEKSPEYRLSSESAREIAGRAGPPPGERRFLSTDHLSTEAAAAYVDGRLPAAGQTRADTHLARCPQCRREIAHQRDARHALRDSGPIRMPQDLRDRLRLLGDGPVPEHAESREPESPLARLVRRLRGHDR